MHCNESHTLGAWSLGLTVSLVFLAMYCRMFQARNNRLLYAIFRFTLWWSLFLEFFSTRWLLYLYFPLITTIDSQSVAIFVKHKEVNDQILECKRNLYALCNHGVWIERILWQKHHKTVKEPIVVDDKTNTVCNFSKNNGIL